VRAIYFYDYFLKKKIFSRTQTNIHTYAHRLEASKKRHVRTFLFHLEDSFFHTRTCTQARSKAEKACEDYYALLGVSQDASEAEIKKAK
jgi:hypothetical protein